MRTETPIASWRSLTKTYRTATARVEALAGITAELPRGTLTALVGPSGSGKSTLLRLVGGMDRPTNGEVFVAGTAVNTASARALRRLRRRRVGYVFQRPSDNFVSYLTVDDHIRIAARHASVINADGGRVLDRLGIANRAGHLPSQLSGGEQQRAAIAQALVAGAELVIADEPTAELDDESAEALLGQIRSLVDAGVTFVVATHDRDVVRKADLVLEIQHGELMSERRRVRAPTDRLPPERRLRIEEATRVEIRGVTKTYPRGRELVHALADVTFDVREGEVAGLIGRSGSGKSTLLNVVAGWEPPDSGSIVWADGSDVGASPAWSEVAVLPQKLGLFDELTVRENVEYPLRLSGMLDERREAVDELLERLHLIQLERRYPKETSVGEQQRTALARALVGAPALLLVDEPTSHQDERSAHAVMDAVRLAADQGAACLVATHSDEVLPYLDTALRMDDGRVARDAS